MNDIGVQTWITHGTLLGWWWNQRILPWDSDLDVQLTEASIAFLANFYNMTEYGFALPEMPDHRTYLLEINPHLLLFLSHYFVSPKCSSYLILKSPEYQCSWL